VNLCVTYYSHDGITDVDLDTLTRVRATDLTPAESTVHVVKSGDYAYLGKDWSWPIPSQIIKVHLPSFTEVNRLDLPEIGSLGGGGWNMALVIVGDILYAAYDEPDGIVNGGIVRIDLNTFTRIDRLDLPVRRPKIITDGTNIYVSYWIPTRIDRIPVATFAIDATINMANAGSQIMLIEGGKLYIGHGNAAPDQLTRIDLPTFAEDASIPLAAGEGWIYGMASDGTYLYLGLGTAAPNPGIIVRVDLATFTRVDALTLPITLPWAAAERDPWSLFVYNNYLWALCESWPANIVKIDLATFTRVDALQLDTVPDVEGDSWSGVLWELGIVAPTVTTNPATGVA